MYYDMTTGYINGPKFCSLASHESKRFDNYSRSDRYKNLLEYMKSSPEYSRAEIIKELKGGRPDLRGTYVHPDLIDMDYINSIKSEVSLTNEQIKDLL